MKAERGNSWSVVALITAITILVSSGTNLLGNAYNYKMVQLFHKITTIEKFIILLARGPQNIEYYAFWEDPPYKAIFRN